MLNILITVDVEIWPSNWGDLSQNSFRQAYQRYIHGKTSRGEYGLPFQLEQFKAHDIKAVFLVESLFACEFGNKPLCDIIDLIQHYGQEVQMHIHPEWIGRMKQSILPGRKARRMMDYQVDEQAFILAIGLENLHVSGVESIQAFRAGGYAANVATLEALERNGILFDTSYNPCFFGNEGGIAGDSYLIQPRQFGNVYEFPIGFFQDWPGHYRHAQLGACTITELESILLQAWKMGWQYFVLVSHGFELLNQAKDRPDPIVVRRFERLLRFLADHEDKFNIIGFSDIDTSKIKYDMKMEPLKSNLVYTTQRYAEQLTRRLFE